MATAEANIIIKNWKAEKWIKKCQHQKVRNMVWWKWAATN